MGIRTSIVLVPFGHIDVINDILAAVKSAFKRQVTIAPEQDPIATKRRGNQFLADDFLPVITYQVKECSGSGGLGITTVDLYVPELNFVFGLASHTSQVAVISIARLGSADRELYLLRCIKEAVHELGHALLGLPHCPNRSCVMTFSNCLADTDFKTTSFCSRCASLVHRKNF